MSRRAAPKKTAILTERDRAILEMIYHFEGVLADYQIEHFFFPNTVHHTAYIRLRRLSEARYLSYPDPMRRAQLPGYTVYCLDDRGITEIAMQEKKLVSELIWRRLYHRWAETQHDILINDFRIALGEACKEHQTISIADWITSQQFWREYDRITFTITKNGEAGRTVNKRAIRPDGFFTLEPPDKKPYLFLLEIDRGTVRSPREWQERLHGTIAYIHSAEYRRRFGANAGRCLMVFQSAQRMKHLHEYAIRELGKGVGVFYFTTVEQIRTITTTQKPNSRKYLRHVTYHDVLHAPIWYKGDADHTAPLIAPHS